MGRKTIKDYFLLVKRRKYFVFLMTIIFTVAAGIFIYVKTEPVYKTYTSLIVEERKNLDDSDSNQKYLDQKFMSTYSEIVKSKLVMNEVRESLDNDISLREMFNNIDVSVVSGTDIIKIEVTGRNPKLIADIANKTAETSIKQIKTMTDIKNIKIIDEAQIPKAQRNSIQKSNIIISGILGFLISITLILITEYFDNTVKSPQILEKHLEIPVIGFTLKSDEALIISEKPDSLGAENYRVIATNIKAIKKNNDMRTILVTSSNPNEGASLVTSNLGFALAKMGKKVLLIDGDLRKPSIHSYFDLDNNLGLSNILSEEIDYKTVIYDDEVESNLHILTSGIPSLNPAEMLASAEMSNFLKNIKKEYDFIIINSPSLGTFADANILSILVDETILVCSARETELEEVKRSKELLKKLNIDILGVVMNNVLLDEDSYYSAYLNNYKFYVNDIS